MSELLENLAVLETAIDERGRQIAAEAAIEVDREYMLPRVYFYTDSEVGVPWPGPDSDHTAHGFPEPRFNWEEMPGFLPTENPTEADVFVVRQRLSWLNDEQVATLPYLKGNEKRHVFFDLADNFYLYPVGEAMQFRGCADREMVEAQPGIVPIAWPVEDFYHLTDWNWEYDVCFQGQHNKLADRAMESCIRAGLKCNFHLTEKFWPHIRNEDPQRGQDLWDSFRENIRSARISLCPRTLDRGVVRYRLYEAMTMQRCSVLIGDDCLLPFPEQINWDFIVLRIPEAAVEECGDRTRAWLEGQPPWHWDELTAGDYARDVWLDFLDRRQYGKMISHTVKERLGLC